MRNPDEPGESMIDLGKATILGEGNLRRTYVHPDDPRLLLKVQVRSFNTKKHWYDRPLKVASSNERELLGWAEVVSGLGRHEPFLTRVLGLENTSEGPALLVENAAADATATISLNKIHKLDQKEIQFSVDEIRWARDEFLRVFAMFHKRRIVNHCMRFESVLLCRMAGGLALKLIDYKTMVYRHLISPRLLPGATLRLQRETQVSMVKRLNQAISRFESDH
ncbi:MAG: YrbL family protein [Pseudomonadota bacterium]